MYCRRMIETWEKSSWFAEQVRWPIRLGLQNTPTAALMRAKTPLKRVLCSIRLGQQNTQIAILKRDNTPPTSVLCPSWLGVHNTPTTALMRGKTHPTSFLDITLNILMVRLQWWWSFEEYWVLLYSRHSKVHLDSTW